MTEAKTELLEKAYQRHLEQYQQVTPNSDWLQQHLADQNFAADLKLLWSCSDFVAAHGRQQSHCSSTEVLGLQQNSGRPDAAATSLSWESLADTAQDDADRLFLIILF